MSYLHPGGIDPVAELPSPVVARWYVLRVVGGREGKALRALQELLRPAGLIAYLPREVRLVGRSYRRGPRARPLVPGYLFAQATEDLFHLIRAADGVIGFLTRQTPGGPAPCPAPPAFITGLAFAEAFRAFDQSYNAPRQFKPKEAVKVSVGKWADWPGKVLRMTDDGRVRVLLSMFGREHEKEFDAGALVVEPKRAA